VAQEEIANIEYEKVKIIKEVCETALNKVTPIYRAAMKAVDALSGSHVTEMKGFSNPPKACLKVAEALCILFNKQGKKIRGQTAAEGDRIDYWETCKKQLLNAKLLGEMKGYDRDNVPEEYVNKLRPVLASSDFTDEKLKSASTAALGIAKWCRAIVDYDDAMKIVRPKQQELKEAEEKQAACQKVVDEAKARLEAVRQQMDELVAKLEETKRKEKELRDKSNVCQNKVDLATSLINNLKDERENWVVSLGKSKI